MDLLEFINGFDKDDLLTVFFPEIVSELPKRISKQESEHPLFKFEYIEQHIGCADDDYWGNMFYELPNGKYLKIGYVA